MVSYPADGPELMAKEKEEVGYTFPYLYDESQAVAHAYQAACTPDSSSSTAIKPWSIAARDGREPARQWRPRHAPAIFEPRRRRARRPTRGLHPEAEPGMQHQVETR